MLNPNTFVSIDEIGNEYKSPSAIYVLYGDGTTLGIYA